MHFFTNRIYGLSFYDFYKHSFFFFISFYVFDKLDLKITKLPLKTFSHYKKGESYILYSTDTSNCFNLNFFLKQLNKYKEINLLYDLTVYNTTHFYRSIKYILNNWYWFFKKPKQFIYSDSFLTILLIFKKINYLFCKYNNYKIVFYNRNSKRNNLFF